MKTSEELLPCPYCGLQPIYEVGQSTGSSSEPDEHYESIYCSNPACIPFEEVESWNTRVNKHAEFLEELSDYCEGESETCRDILNEGIDNLIEKTYNEERKNAFDEILSMIEQFEAKQKQASHDQN